ncbi:hypothetical protein [Sporocytophaga myxococcoides]|nr:hypothetical protein [Sporocytophaga myxococcoides]
MLIISEEYGHFEDWMYLGKFNMGIIINPKDKARTFKMIRVFFLFLLCSNVYGQIDTSKISITNRTYYEYTFSNQDEDEYDYDDYGYDEDEYEVEYENDSDNELEQDQANYDSVLLDLKEIFYPIVKTPNKTLDKFINNTIKDRIGINEFKGSSEKLTLNFEGVDRPSEFYMTYVLNFKNSRYLSFTFSTDEYSGGGSGSAHDQIALTFDLVKSKTLLLKDIVKDQYDTDVYNISITQLKKAVPTLFGEYGEIDNPQLFHFVSTLNFPVAIKKEGVVIYWNLNWGARSAAEEVIIRFDQYSHIFKNDFLKTVKSK